METESNKTVIHCINEYLPLTQTWIYGQLNHLSGFKPIVYTRKTQNLDLFPLDNIRSLNLKPGLASLKNMVEKGGNKLLGYYPSFARFLRQDNPSLIHAHFGHTGYNCLGLKKYGRLLMITTFYGYDVSYLPSQIPKWKKRYKELFQEGQLFLAEGNYMKKELIDLGCPEKKIEVQHLGIDLDKIAFAPKKLNPNETIKILTAASFTEKKGIPYAVEAFGRVKKNNPSLKIEMTVIGDSRGNPEEETIKKKIYDLIDAYGLRDNIRLLGYQPYGVWIKELSKNHIFIHPSLKAASGDTEGGAPVSIIEASAAGLPILATTHCDIPEIVLDRKSGYLVPEKNTEALEQSLMYLISHPEDWRKLGRAGRNHIEKAYNIIIQVERLKDHYRRVLERYKKL